MTPFVPADGEMPRWRRCYDLVNEREVGDAITVEEVMDLCDCSRKAAWNAMWQARERLTADGHRSVETREGFGWVVSRADQHLAAGQRHRGKARKSIRRGLRMVTSARRDELTQMDRIQADRQQHALQMLHDIHGRPANDLAELARNSNRPELPWRER